jgi:hypothetical protein
VQLNAGFAAQGDFVAAQGNFVIAPALSRR